MPAILNQILDCLQCSNPTFCLSSSIYNGQTMSNK